MSTGAVNPLKEERAKASRRAPGEVRQLLFESAREMFATHGYDYSSTKRIAERAGVAEALLFRHFGSKARLFQQAVVEPMAGQLRDCVDRYADGDCSARDGERDRDDEDAQVVRDFVAALYRTLSAQRGAALAMAAVSHYSPDTVAEADAPLAEVLPALEKLLVQHAGRSDRQEIDTALAAKVGVGSVLAAAMFRNWLFDRPESAEDEEIVVELQAIATHGLRNRRSS